MYLLGIIAVLVNKVYSHGFMIGVVDCNSLELLAKIRNYNSITINIDSLRNPLGGDLFCRGEQPGSTISLKNHGTMCIALAISDNAHHKGPCNIEFIDKTGVSTILLSKNDCLDNGCFDRNIPELITNDMCRYILKYETPSVLSGQGIIKWNWEAQHIEPFEHYNNCADINIDDNANNKITGC